jgi:hypothetical protein
MILYLLFIAVATWILGLDAIFKYFGSKRAGLPKEFGRRYLRKFIVEWIVFGATIFFLVKELQ